MVGVNTAGYEQQQQQHHHHKKAFSSTAHCWPNFVEVIFFLSTLSINDLRREFSWGPQGKKGKKH